MLQTWYSNYFIVELAQCWESTYTLLFPGCFLLLFIFPFFFIFFSWVHAPLLLSYSASSCTRLCTEMSVEQNRKSCVFLKYLHKPTNRLAQLKLSDRHKHGLLAYIPCSNPGIPTRLCRWGEQCFEEEELLLEYDWGYMEGGGGKKKERNINL